MTNAAEGAFGMVDGEGIARVLDGAESSEEACRQLVDLALENGGKDNVTVVLARYSIPES